MTSPAQLERPTGLDPAFGYYSPPVAVQEAAPLPILDAWYAVYPDAGTQRIFEAGVEEVVIGGDERLRVPNTVIEPFKWVAMLDITAADGSRWRGTGWLAGPDLVVTAGHCLYMASRGGWVTSIRMLFGVNSDPAGNIAAEAVPPVTATRFRSVTGWIGNQHPESDYGAILLPDPMPAGYGSFSYEARTDSELTGQLFNIDGYPADKPLYSQWYYTRFAAGVAAETLTYPADTFGGDSGGPLYDYNGSRVALGIHTRGDLNGNAGVRITQNVAANLTQWENEAARRRQVIPAPETSDSLDVSSRDIIGRLDSLNETVRSLATRTARLEYGRSAGPATPASQPGGAPSPDEPVSNEAAQESAGQPPADRAHQVARSSHRSKKAPGNGNAGE
jgi:glutamyl endopeptidase